MVVGLTGGIGSGKTTISNLFGKFQNVVIYNADYEAKKLMNSSFEIKSKITEQFGESSYKNNQLNTTYIAAHVFKDKTKLEALNSLVHPEVKNHFQQFISQQKKEVYIIYENAILFESKSNLICDIIISVATPLDIRIKRILLRDNSSEEEVLRRIKSQWLEEKKQLQSHYIIYNQNRENLPSQVVNIHNILTKKNSLI